MTLITQIDDPVYLEEPMIRTSTFRWNPNAREGGLPQVEVADGGRGEFTVTVDGREVAKKTDDNMPEPDAILSAVRDEHHAGI